MTTKSKKTKKKTPPEDKPKNTVEKGKEQTKLPPEDSPPEPSPPEPSPPEGEPSTADVQEELEELMSPSRELLELAIDHWMGTMMKPVMYQLTRTFSHFTVPETFGTTYLFDRFKNVPKGNEELLLKMLKFKEAILSEWDEHPEGRIIQVAGKPAKH